ncbi:arsenate reductase [Stackebrandtia endophytica]|uniref:Arsenate reductase n=1 Tax=Stackebrandtia endophytica TaxID=1496996 RepID=A0A543AQM0_9ACTN|nr:ArsC/Spx/MgsR family protein [Stackebrandtia endophytica]TQL74878.1 arsenate reductase [Stackebrandtia endophytica]
MEEVVIWHNTSCSKSRAAHTELMEIDLPTTVRDYREDPPTPEELAEVLAKAGLEPWQACRTKEAEYRFLGMADWGREAADRDRWLAAMSKHPRIIERPIVIRGERAVIARQPGWQSILD